MQFILATNVRNNCDEHCLFSVLANQNVLQVVVQWEWFNIQTTQPPTPARQQTSSTLSTVAYKTRV